MGSSEAIQSPWMGKDEAQLSLGAVLFLLCWCSQCAGCHSGLASRSQTGFVEEVLARKKTSAGIP